LVKVFRRQGTRKFFARNFNPDDVSMKTHAELAKPERFYSLLALFDGLHGFASDWRSIGDAGTKASGGGPVPNRKSGAAGKLANFCLRQAGLNQRRRHLMQFRRPLTGSIISQIVFVYSVNDVIVAVSPGVGFELCKQFVFAVKAAVFIV